MNTSNLSPLKDGDRVAIIGGGPSGVSAAIALKEKMRALGGDVRVTLVENKQFRGEQQHNQCVGVLSPPILQVFEQDLGIAFPHHLVQSAIQGYVLHTRRRQITLEGEMEPSLGLRRVQFDAYMLKEASERGIEVITARATGLEFHADRVIIYTESLPLEAEVVIGAFGLDEGTAALFNQAVGYHPPPSLSSIVTKYHPDDETMASFGYHIHAFLPTASRIEFGGITPKSNHLTINIAGKKVNSETMDQFLELPEVRQLLPGLEHTRSNQEDLRYFRGAFPRGPARNISGDRFVMVGDAAGLVRAFKGKGVTSAIQTGTRAADTILHQGISAQAFQAYHAANRVITDDLPYGRAMRLLTVWASQVGLMDIVVKAAQQNKNLRLALFEAISAHQTYRSVVRKVLTPASIRAILQAMAPSIRP